MFSIKSMCERVIYLRKGHVVYDGPTDAGIAIYEDDCRLITSGWVDQPPEQWPIRMTGCQLLSEQGDPKTMYDFGEGMKLRLSYATREPLENPNVIVAIIRSDFTLGSSVCIWSPASCSWMNSL